VTRLTNAALAALVRYRRYTEVKESPERAGLFFTAAASSSRMPAWRASRVGHSGAA